MSWQGWTFPTQLHSTAKAPPPASTCPPRELGSEQWENQGLRTITKCCLVVSVTAKLPACVPTRTDSTQNPWAPSCLSTHLQPHSAFPPGTVYTHCDNLCFNITGKRIWC